MDDKTLTRFWAKIRINEATGCWVWIAGCSGRPQHRRPQLNVIENGRWTPRYAYRLAYEHFVGPIPEGLTLDHVKERCATRPMCVNPAHLEPVTQGVNVARGDSFAAFNARKTKCSNGHVLTGGGSMPTPSTKSSTRPRCVLRMPTRKGRQDHELLPTQHPPQPSTA